MLRFGTKCPSMTSTWMRRTPAASASCRRDHGRAVLRAIEAFDLPDVGLDPRILERVDRVDHVARPARPVVRALVAVELFELRLLRWHEELEHELSPRAVQVLGQVAQPSRLTVVHRGVALRVVAHEDLAEGGRERLDVARVIVAVLEIELVLATLLRGGGGEKRPPPRGPEGLGNPPPPPPRSRAVAPVGNRL